MREELLKGLNEEQIAKLKECKSQEEILTIAKEEGIELTDEQLEAVSGGWCFRGVCHSCGADVDQTRYIVVEGVKKVYCPRCGAYQYDL